MKLIENNIFSFIVYILNVFLMLNCGALDKFYVEIINNSRQELKNVNIIYTGGKAQIGKIGIGERQKVQVNPTGESHIEISFSVDNGIEHHDTLNAYIEPSYKGFVVVRIDSSFRAFIDSSLINIY